MATAQTQALRGDPPLRRPTEDEIKQAQEAIRRLDPASSVRLAIRDEDGIEGELALPPLALTLLGQILGEMARGNAVIVESLPRLLTIHQAAGLLGVSSFFMKDLIAKGEVACRMDGPLPLVVFEDLLAYDRKEYEARSKVLDELVAQAQELGMGY